MGVSHMTVNRSIWDQGRSQDFVQGGRSLWGAQGTPYQKLKTHRIKPSVLISGLKDTSQG